VHRRNRRARRTLIGVAFSGVIAAMVMLTGSVGAATTIKPYVEPVGSDYDITPLFSVDDSVPETSNPSQQYRMVGIPDGLGARANGNGTSTLFMNHEFTQATISQPIVGGPEYRGAYVTKWILDADGDPVSGERAYDSVFMENTLVGPAAEVGNSTPAFSRFCSGTLTGPPQGLDRWIYFTNEEEQLSFGPTFDGKGGLSVAIFDNEAHTLPKLGRFSKENTLVQPSSGTQTVIFSLEDGPATLDNQLYMYVGTKDHSAGASALARNGLDNGKLYSFRSLDPDRNNERTFVRGSVTGEWVEIPGAESMTEAQLEAASDAVNAMTFVRPEDGAYNPNNPNEFFFDTTGSSSGVDNGVNELGRLYSLKLNSVDPLKPATLRIVYNADTVVAAGGDIAISPDNLGVSSLYLMINEDGTTESRAVMSAKGRDGSIWRFDLVKNAGRGVGIAVATATRVAQLDPPGRDAVPVGPGIWETSGIIDASSMFGADSWLSDVQAHSPTAPPSAGAVEDGQLFLMKPAS
jgi:secreted PhoX family phosphatase